MNKKTLSLVNNADLQVELNTGKTAVIFKGIKDDNLGIEINHILRSDKTDNIGYGNGVCLNLNETLLKNTDEEKDANYIYTDCFGQEHLVKERFYYVDENGERVDIEKSDVNIFAEGKLQCSANLKNYHVVREELTSDGMIASTICRDINGIELIKQESSEIEKLKEQIKLYNDGINDIVSVQLEDASTVYLTKNEKISYEALISQKTCREGEIDYIKQQIVELQEVGSGTTESLKDTFNKFINTDALVNNQEFVNEVSSLIAVESNGKTGIEFSFPTDENDTEALKTNIKNFLNNYAYHFSKIEYAKYKSLVAQYDITLENDNETEIKKQINNIQEQIDYILSRSDNNEQNYIDYKKEKNALMAKLYDERMKTAVNYIFDGAIVKGFNENGNLVMIYGESCGKITVIYEPYFNGNIRAHRASKLVNEDNNEITLSYNSNGLLKEIISSNGETTTYEYDAECNLTRVIYSNNKELAFERETDYLMVINDDRYARIVYTNNMLAYVESFSRVEKVTNGGAVLLATPQRIERIDFVCGLNATVTNSAENLVEQYKFNSEGYIEERYVTRDGIYIEAKLYIPLQMGHYTVITANEEALYDENVNVADNSYVESKSFDSFNRIKTESIVNKTIHISDGEMIRRDLTTTYTYNEKNQVVKAVTTENIHTDTALIKSFTHVALFEYNDRGQLLKKQSYTEGEEKTNGINIEEHVYDKNGFEIKKITYNSLDPSSKYYEEIEVNEKGQKIAEFDLLGKNRTMYEYFDGTNTVCSTKYPNGSRYSFGVDNMNGNSAITQSTADGEENSITTLRTNSLVTNVKDQANEYDYEYEYKGRISKIKQNGSELVNFEYTDTASKKTVKATMKSGLIKIFEKEGELETTYLTNIRNSNIDSICKVVEADGRLVQKYLMKGGTCERNTQYYYSDNNLTRKTLYLLNEETGGTIPVIQEDYTYNTYGDLIKKQVSNAGTSRTYNYIYSTDSQRKLRAIRFGDIIIAPKYDCLGRKTGKDFVFKNSTIAKEKIEYLKQADHTTMLPNQISYFKKSGDYFAIGDKLKYTYDKMGNVSSIYKGSKLICEYKYDALGRLVRENNQEFNRTALYEYDNIGNIINKKYTTFTLKPKREITDFREYKYEYLDDGKLLKIGGAVYITDPKFGYPSVWRGTKSIIWDVQHKMIQFGDSYFEYDVEGRRKRKNDITYLYDANDNLVKQSNGIEFLYDNEGCIGFKYTTVENEVATTATYFYRKDIFGNVIEILDSEGNTVVKYVYDAWGNHSVLDANGATITDEAHIGRINPIRYRSYYYDTETKLYYLNARYYDPEVCRFISPDDINYLDPETIGGTNLYAYCLNNPVMYVDPNGNFGIFSFLIGLAATTFFTWLGGEIFGNQVVSGITSIGSGISAMITGASLFAFGPVGWILGGTIGLVGLTTALLGVNETVAGITGTNYLQKWTGMSDDWYNGLYTGFNIASSVGTLIGSLSKIKLIRKEALSGVKNAQYGPSALKHISERSYYDSLLLKQQIIKNGKIRKAKYGVKGYEFSIKGYTSMGSSGNIHFGTWSLVYGEGIIWHFLLN
ncbi:MAG: hypothetical protein IJW54_00105 [Clostridia bacterium]|nr:hypothetical protein [Clostridia bacterium]